MSANSVGGRGVGGPFNHHTYVIEANLKAYKLALFWKGYTQNYNFKYEDSIEAM